MNYSIRTFGVSRDAAQGAVAKAVAGLRRAAATPRCTWETGFTLVEMAIVLVILVVLTGGLMSGLTSQVDARNQARTEQTLTDIREALLGFAAAQGRLPCPAAPNGGGSESPAGGGACTNALDGFVPGSTLGLGPTDGRGYVLDGWNRPLRYAVANDRSYAFTSAGGMRGATLATLNADMGNNPGGFLKICSAASGSTTACAATTSTLSSNALAVVYSLGRNGASGGTGVDERQNPNPNGATPADIVFVSHEATAAGSPGGEFDDIVSWISPYTLYSRMIAAGQLP